MKAFKNLNKEIKVLDFIKVEKKFFRQKTFFQIKKSFYSKKEIVLDKHFQIKKMDMKKNASDLTQVI